MRKIASVLFMVGALGLASTAQAHHYGHHGYHYHPHYGWVLPSIVGGMIGYEIARNQQPQVIVQQPPVVIQQQPQSAIQTQTCTPWIERQEADGRITRTRTCTQ
jgi:hypothetical protein